MKVISEGPIRITKSTIDSAWRRRKTAQRLVLRDLECRGLSLIVNATSMTWSYAYRPRGNDPQTKRRWPNKTVTIGNPATHSPEDARTEANQMKGQAAAGADPSEVRKERAAEEQRKRVSTLQRLFEDYKTALPKRRKMRGTGKPSPAYISEEIAQVGMSITEMGAKEKPAKDLTDRDVLRLLNAAEGVTTARKRYASLSRFLDWCRDERHIVANPCSLIPQNQRPQTPQSRSEYLEPAALARLWKAAGALKEPVWRDLVRFLIALPCRRGEATSLDWSHLDLEKAEWRQPGKLTKNRDPHRVHLHPLALEVLETRRHAWAETAAEGDPATLKRLMAQGVPRSGLVFPSPRSNDEIDTFTAIKAKMLAATKPPNGEEGEVLTGWTWHDFRRSFATALGEASIPEVVADAILNHRQAATRGGVLGVYQRASRWPEQVRATELWGRLLTAAIQGRTDANVLQLSARAV